MLVVTAHSFPPAMRVLSRFKLSLYTVAEEDVCGTLARAIGGWAAGRPGGQPVGWPSCPRRQSLVKATQARTVGRAAVEVLSGCAGVSGV